MANTTIGFIGAGVMGRSMANNLIDAGYNLSIYTRTKEKAQTLLDKGASWKDTVGALAASADVIISIVGYPQDVEEVYFGEDGILANAKKGAVVIDMTTSKPKLAADIHQAAAKKGVAALDAPVSGGDVGAKNGTLAIMVGGDASVFDNMQGLFDILGSEVILQGEAGAGQHTKLCNQITIASNMIGVCEAIIYAQKAGLDPSRVLDSITTGAAGSFSLSKLGPRMIKGDFAPGFYVKHMIKDMTIALESAQEMGMSTPGLDLSLKLYKQLAEKGYSDSGTQALIKLLESE